MADVYKGLAKSLPVINDKARKQREAAQTIQTQAALGQAQVQPGTNVQRATQQIAPAVAQQTGQAAVAERAQQQQQAAGLAGQALARDAQTQQTELAKRGQAQETELAGRAQAQELQIDREKQESRAQLSKEEQAQAEQLQEQGLAYDSQIAFLDRSEREQLAKMGADARQKLFDARLTFDESEGQRKFTNQLQLLDFAKATAQSEQDFLTKAQNVQQAYAKEQILYSNVIAKLEQALKQGFLDSERELDQASKKKIASAINAMKKKQAEKQRNGQIISAVVGAGVGVVTANPYAGMAAYGAAQQAQGG